MRRDQEPSARKQVHHLVRSRAPLPTELLLSSPKILLSTIMLADTRYNASNSGQSGCVRDFMSTGQMLKSPKRKEP